jgi:ATP-dependent DNA ligase
MKHEAIYRKTKTGAVQVCNISVTGCVFHVAFGQLNGKMQEQHTECFPVNVGKSNETTAEEQALKEAKSKWVEKVKAGYSTNIEAPVTVQLPQLVKKYLDNKDKVKFPCYSAVKLNGINGTYWLMPDTSLKLTSRGGNEYPPIPHLEAQARARMTIAKTTSINGELYIHGQYLEDINSAVKKTKALSSQLTFNTFELPLVDGPYEGKVDMLHQMCGEATITEVFSAEEADALHSEAVANGYEGTVLFNKDAVYAFNERSSSVYKYKIAIDAEFRVVGFHIDKNKHAVYACESKGGEFKAKRVGTDAERLSDAAIAKYNIGKWLNVEFEMYSKKGKPLKPVGQHFRLCDKDGTPLE